LWWAVHLFFLIGFRNRFIVMFGWVWNYLTFQRGARLITGLAPDASLGESVDETQRASQRGSAAR
jgi:NADH dehydrogenase